MADRAEFTGHRRNDRSGRGPPEKTERELKNMGVEAVADLQKNFLSQVFLQNIGGVFQHAGQKYGREIEAAVKQQAVGPFQMDGDIDDPFLHFQGKDPEKKACRNHEQQHGLKQAIPVEYPVEERFLSDHWRPLSKGMGRNIGSLMRIV